ncbi:hypothetical protein JVU11DRAFT_5843 [Chiua virens]|nr:hypothetical protein JVU11DRAFT_5843 [Chiua virens]
MDVKLCTWWKRQLSMVAEDVLARAISAGHAIPHIRLFYLLPGLGELKACHAMDRVYVSTSSPCAALWSWSYGHPYRQMDMPLPCVPIRSEEKPAHIGHVIPWFDDDPKARFLDKIVYMMGAEGIKSPERKRPRTHRTTAKVEQEGESGKEGSSTKMEQTSKALKKVSVEEFWERIHDLSLEELQMATAISKDILVQVLSLLAKAKILVNEEMDQYDLNPNFKSV